ncbi:DUF3558 family protein [Rhodococcoides kyotonense]|uniref:DUF3558 domain-containing protein n=1 Tax=Rhodococcoides kyotonense TaxID=398843 RepID=A0A239F0T7_9NOCA|nr:DUF3558 family protein [Rhodococcus kyotonensis]SNS50311.1 Protein of unknown function [Rhodococcus kyotonensis]
MGKKLAIAFCALVLTACAQTVTGTAVGDDASDGQGVPATSTVTESASTPASFDPCGWSESELSIVVGVDPSSKIEVPDGCAWSGEDIGFASMAVATSPAEAVSATPGITELTEMDVEGRAVRVFEFEGDACFARAEIGPQTIQFTMVEDVRSPYCAKLRLAVAVLMSEP